MFEDEEYVPEAPFAPSSDSSRPKNLRLYEPLEGSSEGPTDPTEGDDDSGGATIRGSASTPTDSASDDDDIRGSSSEGSGDTPISEPGWLVA